MKETWLAQVATPAQRRVIAWVLQSTAAQQAPVPVAQTTQRPMKNAGGSVPKVEHAPEHGGAAASSASGIRRAPSLAGGSRVAKRPRLRLQESLRKRAHDDTSEESSAPAIVEEWELQCEQKRGRGPAAIFDLARKKRLP